MMVKSVKLFGIFLKFANYSLLGIVLLSLIYTGTALAQNGSNDGPTDDEVNAIAKQMYCPVCENTPLDVCPTQACAEWRELIRQKLADGWSEDQIKQYFVEQYGDRVLAEPPARGLNWLVYIIPPIAILAGIYILYRAFQSWRQPLPEIVEAGASAEKPKDEYVERLEEELRKL
jgi:cytochrome c-type biogenesis protein CcmH